jgi:hypothetical protein
MIDQQDKSLTLPADNRRRFATRWAKSALVGSVARADSLTGVVQKQREIENKGSSSVQKFAICNQPDPPSAPAHRACRCRPACSSAVTM